MQNLWCHWQSLSMCRFSKTGQNQFKQLWKINAEAVQYSQTGTSWCRFAIQLLLNNWSGAVVLKVLLKLWRLTICRKQSKIAGELCKNYLQKFWTMQPVEKLQLCRIYAREVRDISCAITGQNLFKRTAVWMLNKVDFSSSNLAQNLIQFSSFLA